ncbi:VanZ family protein [Candidatus Aciduliprofundum boonei]|uniref:VanZ family protein n=1 Tax=Aciduliprofundum boonei (strain DSM 19572 / T469) TaxID=439481 RepID=B5IAH8_ACIB4|nr:VanZ family protein [Candidatus Aciduliprofundum boonei]ADD08666.1 VanZ family protein [Aciduliprofundum boonei T469]EDY37042.1 hypothetical protein ABOONEI_1963 [Aciduliprofundum boonei T469]HII55896.1 VanZ family protein [Candidatus Aciduliprofundum boonei]
MKRRNEYLTILILYSIFIFALSATPGKDIPSDVTHYSFLFHFVLYFGYAISAYLFFKNYYHTLIFVALYAATDEFHQYFVPSRHCDPMDWTVDFLAALVALAIIFLVKKRLLNEKR